MNKCTMCDRRAYPGDEFCSEFCEEKAMNLTDHEASKLATQTKRANIAENRLAVLIGWQCEDKATTLAEVDKEIENERKGKDNKGN